MPRFFRYNFRHRVKGIFPVDLLANTPQRHMSLHKLHLYAAPMGEAISQTEAIPQIEVLVTILWVPNSQNEESWTNLVMAFEAFNNKAYDSTIIPANVSVESKLSRILSDSLSNMLLPNAWTLFWKTQQPIVIS